MNRFIAAGLLTAISLATFPVTANTNNRALDIDWVIPKGAIQFGKANLAAEGTQFTFDILPRELYASPVEVVAADGTKLLPAGAQLYAMIGELPMACSQEKSPVGYVGESKRICVRDTDADGTFDSFFTLGRGRSALTSDSSWFAINSKLPSRLSALQPLTLASIDREFAALKPKVEWTLSASRPDVIWSRFEVEGRYKLSAQCGERIKGPTTPSNMVIPCGGPDISVRSSQNVDTGQIELDLQHPDRDIGVQFFTESNLFIPTSELTALLLL